MKIGSKLYLGTRIIMNCNLISNLISTQINHCLNSKDCNEIGSRIKESSHPHMELWIEGGVRVLNTCSHFGKMRSKQSNLEKIKQIQKKKSQV